MPLLICNVKPIRELRGGLLDAVYYVAEFGLIAVRQKAVNVAKAVSSQFPDFRGELQQDPLAVSRRRSGKARGRPLCPEYRRIIPCL